MQRRHSRVFAASSAALIAVTLSACASSDRDSGDGGGDAAAQTGGTLVFGAAGDPTNLDPAFASDGETFRVAPPDLRGSARQPSPAAPSRCPASPRTTRSATTASSTRFTLQRGREVPRRHGLQRRGGLLQLRALVQLRPAWPRARARRPTGRTSSAGSPTRRTRPTSTPAARRRDDAHRRHHPQPSHQSVPRRADAAQLLDPEPDGAGGVRRRQPVRHRGRVRPTRSTGWSTRPAPARSSSRAGTAATGEVTIVRNDDYWGDKALLDEVIFRAIDDGNTRRQEFQAGSLDGYDFVAPADYETLGDDGAQVLVRDPFNVLYLGINGGNVEGTTPNPALQDPRVRQAIAHAIDRETIVTSLLPDGAEVATQFMPPTVDGWADDVTTYDYDPDLARQLLAEAGPGEPHPAVLLPDRRQPPVPAGPGRDVPGHQRGPVGGRHHHRADGAAVEPGLPAGGAGGPGGHPPARLDR